MYFLRLQILKRLKIENIAKPTLNFYFLTSIFKSLPLFLSFIFKGQKITVMSFFKQFRSMYESDF